MKRIYYTMCSLAAAMLSVTSCSNDDETITPHTEKDWLVVTDNPSDVLDHTRYEIFAETGIPIYYNDTIGTEQRTTLAGQTYTHYERLQVFYEPGRITPSWDQANYALPHDRNDILAVVEFLRDEVLQSLPKGMYVPSVLLTDSLNSTSGTVAFKGLNTIVLSNVNKFKSLDEIGRKFYRAAFLRSVVAGTLLSKDEEWLEENFYALSYAVAPDNKEFVYSNATYGYMVYKSLYNLPMEQQTIYTLGFIGTRVEPKPGTAERMKIVPEKSQDVSQFCEAIFAYTKDEFYALHADHPVVLEKYEVMKAKLQQYGFVIE